MRRAPVSPLPARAIPAWLLSAVLHAGGLVLLLLLVRGGVPRTADESERPVAIVLARNSGESIDDAADSPADTEEPAPEQALTDAARAALPPADMAGSLVLSDLALPRPAAGGPLSQGVVHTPRLSVRGPAGFPVSRDQAAIRAEQEALRQARRAQGPLARIRLFGGSVAEGRSFVFLIDRSKSMGGQGLNALVAAERELVAALQSLQPVHRFQVVAYHHKCVYLDSRQLLPASPENKRRVDGFLSDLAAFGPTEHELALMSCLRMRPDVIFLLTDGGDPRLNEGQVRSITRLAAGRTAIHCVHFGFEPQQNKDNFLQRLASRNSGGYRYVDMSEPSR